MIELQRRMNRILLNVCAALAIICCANGAGAFLSNTFLSNFLPAITSTKSLDLDRVLANEAASSNSHECGKCDRIADLTRGVTDLLSWNAKQPIRDLVQLQCVKAGSSYIFPFKLGNAQRNPTKQFNNNAPYGFVIHGFTDFYPGFWPIQGEGWMKHSMIEWAKHGVNVCAVDWGKLSLETFNYYVVSQKNTVRVANFLIELLKRFERHGVDLANTTLVGHSLGAQISGKVGASLRAANMPLGRIYGIDPAGPCYTHPCKVSEKHRLDASDANYVQCIHSNIGLWGTVPRCGCEDFYLNAGIIQPGAIDPISAHFFSVNIFEWTLNPRHKCYSTTGRELIGINSQGVCGVYKVKTRAKQPYC